MFLYLHFSIFNVNDKYCNQFVSLINDFVNEILIYHVSNSTYKFLSFRISPRIVPCRLAWILVQCQRADLIKRSIPVTLHHSQRFIFSQRGLKALKKNLWPLGIPKMSNPSVLQPVPFFRPSLITSPPETRSKWDRPNAISPVGEGRFGSCGPDKHLRHAIPCYPPPRDVPVNSALCKAAKPTPGRELRKKYTPSSYFSGWKLFNRQNWNKVSGWYMKILWRWHLVELATPCLGAGYAGLLCESGQEMKVCKPLQL